MSEEQKSVNLPALDHLNTKVTSPQTLRQLIMQPGNRVRAFDDLKIPPEQIFLEGTEAGTFVRNPETALALLSPPYDQDKTHTIFEQLAKLDSDIKNHKTFLGIIMQVNDAINKMPIADVKDALKAMNLKEEELPKDDNDLRKLLQGSVEEDLRSAYRFKTLSSTTYYDTPAANGRVKDFAQGYNTAYRDYPNDEKAALEKLMDKTIKEFGDRVTDGVGVTTDGKGFTSIDSAAKDLVSHKAFDRLGLEGAIEVITKGLQSPKFNEVANKEQLITKVKALYQLKIEIDNANNNTNRPGLDGFNEIITSDSYKAIADKSIANAILLEHVATLPSSTFKDELSFEISKHALEQAFDEEVKKNLTAQEIIDNLYNNKGYQALGEETGSEILMTKINGLTNQTLKTALIADFNRRIDNAIKRELSGATVDDAKTKMEKLLEDKHFPLVDQQQAHKRIIDFIDKLPDKEKKEVKEALLTQLNLQTNNQYTFPKPEKSAIAKFFDKTIKWVKDIPNKLSKLGSTIMRMINPPPPPTEPKFHGDTSITTHPDTGISNPTISDEMKDEIARRHKTAPISKKEEKQEVRGSLDNLTEEQIEQKDVEFKEEDRKNRQTSETAFKRITEKCLLLAQSLKNRPLPEENTFKSDLIIAQMQFDQLKGKINSDLAEGKISKDSHQSLISKISSIEGKVAKIEVVYDNLKRQGKSDEAKQDSTLTLDGERPRTMSESKDEQKQPLLDGSQTDSTLGTYPTRTNR